MGNEQKSAKTFDSYLVPVKKLDEQKLLGIEM